MINKNDQVTDTETAEILRLAKKCLDLEGDFVELGCYKGDTSVLLGKLLANFSSAPGRESNIHSAVSSQNYYQLCGKHVQDFHNSVDKILNYGGKHADKIIHSVEKHQKDCAKIVDKFTSPVENPCKNSGQIINKVTDSSRKTSADLLALTLSRSSSVRQISSRLESCPEKRLWIYDSFAGLPPKLPQDSSSAGINFQGGELAVTKREVVDKIRHAGLKNVIIKKAWFEELTNHDLPYKIAFAFLDGDFYSSIKTSLKLVLPLMHSRGIMIVHDYNNPELPGSTRAVDEFLKNHPTFQLQVKCSLAILTQK